MNLTYELEPGAFPPEKAHSTDMGFDLRVMQGQRVQPLCQAEFDTGVRVRFPASPIPGVLIGGLILDKSGLASRGLTILGGVIDPGYTGPLVVVAYNSGPKALEFAAGDKIAQLVMVPFIAGQAVPGVVQRETARGAGGFGSTGR